MNIPIKVSINNFFKMLLTMMNKFPPIRGLRERELDVLAEIMLQNYENRSITDFNKRQILIFSTENRIKMQERLNMKEGSFNDYMSKLRRKGVIKDNKLLPFLNILPEGKYSFNINFTINE